MNRLTCEMCGSTEMIKQDGMFVCQSCGTKYSVEEAKKLMIEGTVDVSGSTVKVDNTNELENLYQIARRAKDEENAENAAKYYDMILVKDPNSWEATFYSVYYKALNCTIAQIESAANSVNNVEESVMKLIKEHVSKDKQEEAVKEIVNRCILIAEKLDSAAYSHYVGIDYSIQSHYKFELYSREKAAANIVFSCGTRIEKYFQDTPAIAKMAADAWKAGIELYKFIYKHYPEIITGSKKEALEQFAKKIGKYDLQYANQYNQYKDEQQKAETKMKSGLNFAFLYFLVAGILCIIIGVIIDMPEAKVFCIIIGIAALLFSWYTSNLRKK